MSINRIISNHNASVKNMVKRPSIKFA